MVEVHHEQFNISFQWKEQPHANNVALWKNGYSVGLQRFKTSQACIASTLGSEAKLECAHMCILPDLYEIEQRLRRLQVLVSIYQLLINSYSTNAMDGVTWSQIESPGSFVVSWLVGSCAWVRYEVFSHVHASLLRVSQLYPTSTNLVPRINVWWCPEMDPSSQVSNQAHIAPQPIKKSRSTSKITIWTSI